MSLSKEGIYAVAKIMNYLEKPSWQSRLMASTLDGMFVACIGNILTYIILLIFAPDAMNSFGAIVLIPLLIIGMTIYYIFIEIFGFLIPLVAVASWLWICHLYGYPGTTVSILLREDVPAFFLPLFTLPTFLLGPLPLLISSAYQILTESSSQQATFGKLIKGLAVVDTDGNRISVSRALSRYLLKGLSLILLGLPQLMFAFGEKQTLYDKASGCVVIKKGRKVACL
jgi:uncharacterized RDD family membrane protein YckC